MNQKLLPSKAAAAELRKLGENIAIARKRRHITQKHLADAASVTTETIRRLEKGIPGISVGTLAMVLLALGENGHLGNILSPITDDIGMVASLNDLPKRVREKRLPANASSAEAAVGHIVSDGKYVGF